MSFVETVEPLHSSLAQGPPPGSVSPGGDNLDEAVYVERASSPFDYGVTILHAVHWYCITGMWIAAVGLLGNVFFLAYTRYQRDALHVTARSPPVAADKRSLRKPKLT